MISEAQLIHRIKEEQAKFARASVEFPPKDPLGQGVLAGKWQGLELAIQLVNEVLSEAEEKD